MCVLSTPITVQSWNGHVRISHDQHYIVWVIPGGVNGLFSFAMPLLYCSVLIYTYTFNIALLKCWLLPIRLHGRKFASERVVRQLPPQPPLMGFGSTHAHTEGLHQVWQGSVVSEPSSGRWQWQIDDLKDGSLLTTCHLNNGEGFMGCKNSVRVNIFFYQQHHVGNVK
jgi:hypothetical protein